MTLLSAKIPVLLLAAVLLQTGAGAEKVTYTSGPLGVGPDNNPLYVKGRKCGQLPADIAWDRQLGPYNDSVSNPKLLPVTEVRTRWAASLQMVFGDTVGDEHGFRNTRAKAQEVLQLKPGEVITKVEFQGLADGLITNLTFTTNASRVWVPDWRMVPDGSQQVYIAEPPEADTWTGPPVVGGWYLAYTYATVVGWCKLLKEDLTTQDGPGYYFTPVLYFVWAADAVPAAASPVPSVLPSPPGNASTTATTSPIPVAPPKSTKKGGGKGIPKMAIIGGIAGGAVVLITLAACLWVFCRHGRSKLGENPFMKSFSTAAPGMAGMAAGGAVAGGGAAGGVVKDVGDAESGYATSVPVTGAAARDLPPSPFVGHPPAAVGNPYSAPSYSSIPPTSAVSLAPSYPSTRASITASQVASEAPVLGAGGFTAASVAGSARPSSAGGVVTVSRPSAPRGMAPGGTAAPGMMGGGGAGAVGPMAAVGAAGIAVVGTMMLAKEILDAGDRVVANHARCLRLTTRIHSILPLLNWLHAHLEKEAAARGDQSIVEMQHLVDNLNGVFGDVRDCINRWCGSEATVRKTVLVKVLRNLMVSKRFEDEFLDLNERLSTCYQDLILALNIKRAITSETDPERVRQQHEEDVAADLKGVAEELSTEEGEQAWNSLPSEERATIREAFMVHGLNFNTLMTQARKNAVGERVKDLIIPWTDIKVMAEVGSGGYGTVFRGTWQDIDVAVKKLQLTVVTERAKRELSHEAYIMSLLRHPNVATCYGMVLERNNCALVMKFYQKGTLLELLHDDTQPLTLRRKLQLASDVAKGMTYLHNRPNDAVIHGDLKPSNLLIDDDGKVVITDFGLSRVSTLTLTTRPSSSGMSVTYTAPEILADPTGKRTVVADVYAYGLVLFEIFTRELPFESAADVMAVVQYVLGGGRPKVVGAEFDALRVPKEVVELMQACWQQVPQARPSFADILEKLKAITLASTASTAT